MGAKPKLTIEFLTKQAAIFSKRESGHSEASLFGVTDGKAVGTYLEHKFRSYLQELYDFVGGNSASGIDFPDLLVDMKVTSVKQPQSSCPFKSAKQKIYGLGYSLLVFVYDKEDFAKTKTSRLRILHAVFVDAHRTGDYQTTRRIREILEHDGNKDDLMAFMEDIKLPVEDIEAGNIADEILKRKPELGFLTISNALQWRLQYQRVIDQAGHEEGVRQVYKG